MKKTICITLEEALIGQARLEAAKEGRSLSNWFERLVGQFLAQR